MISDPLRHENTFSVTDPNHYAQTPQTTNEIQWEATEKEMIQSRQRNIMMSYEQSQVKMLWMRGYISFRESVREFKVSRKHRSQVKMLWNENSWLYFISRASQRDQSVPQEHTLDFTKLFILHLSRKVQTPPLFSMAQGWFSTIETIACCAGGGRVDKAGRGGTARHIKK